LGYDFKEEKMPHCKVIVIGEVLMDVFPGYERTGGAPFNFAYHLLKMGVPVCLITRIGRDSPGQRIANLMELNGFDLRFVQRDEHHQTGKVMVSLDSQGNPTFDILEDMAYDHIDVNNDIFNAIRQKPDLIYFGTLAQRTDHGHDVIQRILAAREPNTRCLYDVNLRQGGWREKVVSVSLEACDGLKLNEEELKKIKIMLGFSGSDADFIDFLMHAYRINFIALTRGKAGSALYSLNGVYEQGNMPLEISGDTVGAGDAYASMLALGYIHKWPPVQIVETATELARRVCGIKGAIPAEAGFYDGLIKNEKGTV
jgi:fructokinase